MSAEIRLEDRVAQLEGQVAQLEAENLKNLPISIDEAIQMCLDESKRHKLTGKGKGNQELSNKWQDVAEYLREYNKRKIGAYGWDMR